MGEAGAPGPPRIRVLLDFASQWCPLQLRLGRLIPPTDLPFSLSSHRQAKLREFWARAFTPSVVGSSTVASRDDVVSENNRGEGPGVRGHRRLVMVQHEAESDTDSVRSEPEGAEASDMESVGGIPAHADGFASLDGVPQRDVSDTSVSVMHSVPLS